MAKKRGATRFLRSTLCALLLVFSSVLLFQCSDKDEVEDFLKSLEEAGLIPISTLEPLSAMRYDLNGDGKVDHKGGLTNIAVAEMAYAAVFPRVAYDANKTDKYIGYILANDLDFNDNASYNDATTKKPRWTPNSATNPTNSGWNPIGFFNSSSDNASFTGEVRLFPTYLSTDVLLTM